MPLSRQLSFPTLLICLLCLIGCSRGNTSRFLSLSTYNPWERQAARDAEKEPITEEYMQEFEDDYGVREERDISDPLRRWNLLWFHFNDFFYFNMLKPAGKGYNYVTPRGVQKSVSRFFVNLRYPGRVINQTLQGEMKSAWVETARFGTNTTLGVAGLFDPATAWFDMPPPPREDFDQTFGVYGVPTGFYLVWPLFGPSSVRGTVGLILDKVCDPLTYATQLSPAFHAAGPVEMVNRQSISPRTDYETLMETAVDPYVALRSAHIQNLEKRVAE